MPRLLGVAGLAVALDWLLPVGSACGPAGPQRPVGLSRMATHRSRWDRLLCPHGLAASIGLRSSREAHRSRLPSLPRGRAPPAGGLRPPSRDRTPRKPQNLPRILRPLRASCFTTARPRCSTHQVGPLARACYENPFRNRTLARKSCVRWQRPSSRPQASGTAWPGAWGLEPAAQATLHGSGCAGLGMSPRCSARFPSRRGAG